MRTSRHPEGNGGFAVMLWDVTRDQSQQRRGGRALSAIIVIGLLLFLLPFAANQHGVPLAFALLPVLFFGTVCPPLRLAPLRETNKVLPRQAPALASLFQRPPPV